MPPKVAIVGRPNVGKSSLLNMLAGRRISIVDPTAGVTRDRVSALAALRPWAGQDRDQQRHVELIDTGGYGIDDVQDLTTEVERQIALALGEADLVLFVVDSQTGLLPLDQRVAQLLRRDAGKLPVLLVANKVDADANEADAHAVGALGFGEPVMVSAVTGHHKSVLLEAIDGAIDWDRHGDQADAEPEDAGVLLAIVGKRNAGKSSLVNALAGHERMVVSQAEGTTRDAVDVRLELRGRRFTAIDTAGVRKRKSLTGDIEYYSHHRALRSIRRAAVVAFVIDSTVPISQVDTQLAQEIVKHHKPVVLVVNKWDLAERGHDQQEYADYLDQALKGLDFAPIVFTSAAQSQGLEELLKMALNLHEQAGHRVGTGELNRAVEAILAERTPHSGIGRGPKIYYCTQLDVHPPTVGLFVNDPTMFDPAYQRFLLNRLRDTMPWSEVPIKLVIRGKDRAPSSQR